ncbi:MAG: Hsp20/alpha crystallin family protein [Methanotrichaceae archaeon]|nr:Hsp20/alpha crystallin family protein [Methanotrichaceae archaeon]
MEKEPKDWEDARKAYEERIGRLEEKIEELEKKSVRQDEDIRIEGITESVIGQFVPGLGGIIKALEQSSPEFKKKIAETDAEIRHRIDVGWSSKPVVDYHVSTRPVRHGTRRTPPRPDSVKMPQGGPTREPIVDVLEGKDEITVIAELPGVAEDELLVRLEGDFLEISAGQLCKKVTLPRKSRRILEKSFKNGILQIKLD